MEYIVFLFSSCLLCLFINAILSAYLLVFSTVSILSLPQYSLIIVNFLVIITFKFILRDSARQGAFGGRLEDMTFTERDGNGERVTGDGVSGGWGG